MNLTAVEAKPFVPASDFERAKDFYLAVGCHARRTHFGFRPP